MTPNKKFLSRTHLEKANDFSLVHFNLVMDVMEGILIHHTNFNLKSTYVMDVMDVMDHFSFLEKGSLGEGVR